MKTDSVSCQILEVISKCTPGHQSNNQESMLIKGDQTVTLHEQLLPTNRMLVPMATNQQC